MAKKYIDADLLRKEIESRMGDCDANSKNPNQLLWAELAALLPFLDSLQQEQSCDTVLVRGAGAYDGEWIVEDTMAKRYAGTDRVDFLVPEDVRLGRWEGVEIYKKR